MSAVPADRLRREKIGAPDRLSLMLNSRYLRFSDNNSMRVGVFPQ